jgi:2-C-methyl-D-erythritol 2,4-cyclodiphosphate synthase
VIFRIGHGYDAHRIEPGDGLALGGVFIPCAWRIIAHSDGDVLIHALCDALLGAIAGGDIGKLFPDTDARFKGINSRLLLREVTSRLIAQGWQLVNADLSLIAQVPRVSPRVSEMCEVLAADLGVQVTCINIKATTNEGMGHIGRKEGIAAHAVVLVSRI